MTAAAESELWDTIARADTGQEYTVTDQYGRQLAAGTLAPLDDGPAAAGPLADCPTCEGTGYDEAFASPCDCARHTGTSSLAQRFAGQAGSYDARTDRAYQPGDRLDGRTFGRTATKPKPATPATTDDDPATVAELVAWLAGQTWSTFAVDLAAYHRRRGTLTPRQLTAARSMRAKCEARRASQTAAGPDDEPAPALPVDVPAGRYAVEEPAGSLHFYKVDVPDAGRWKGYRFVDEQAGPNEYPVRDRARRARILAAIAIDPRAALIRYGLELGHCGRCGTELTKPASRAAGIGPYCATQI